jgi:very-short-patch-repair endonuclease
VGVKERHAEGAVKRGRRLRREMTLPEQVLWKGLRALGLHMRRQAPLGRYVVDFACYQVCLVIEVDGEVHNLPDVQRRDAIRDAWLRSEGYRVLRFRNRQVLEDLDAVIETIRATLPPRWGKGRDGGECAGLPEMAFEAASPPAPVRRRGARTPTLGPSPIEGEGGSKACKAAP